ncbi:CAAX prenyl protease-like protein [Aquimarina sp. MAR_2010_214]|uniref:CPBP family intramembrane glutamic endopeptidase n=1 Tax=Aquimarina sp. MAR_2010_214 TaxID=1250026 RepID=UPI000C70FC02|nr:CPBP family intramembrane glutamic endopeptidase [Aquimarina sp. MAR_2010_214]PKV52846.1 CAAX prenyl protease-like protein [Aquimarina sp. MAR_2010_214]
MRAYAKRNPITSFFILTFIISWSGILIVASQTGIPATAKQFDKLLPIAMIPYLFGPSIAGFVMLGITKGKKGFKMLFKKLVKWRLGTRLYLIAIFTIPILSIISLFILNQFSEVYTPDIITTDDKITLILSGLIYGIVGGGILEEFGWSGFATPKLRERYGVVKTGLIIGLLWGVWHFLPVIWGSGNSSGDLVLSKFLPGLFFHYAGLIPIRIMIVWLYDKSNSLILPIIMHATGTASTFFIFNISEVGIPLFTYYFLLAFLLWSFIVLIRYKFGL